MINNITTDCDTLICINTCEKDAGELEYLKKSDFYKKLKETDGIGIIEVYRGVSQTKFELFFPRSSLFELAFRHDVLFSLP